MLLCGPNQHFQIITNISFFVGIAVVSWESLKLQTNKPKRAPPIHMLHLIIDIPGPAIELKVFMHYIIILIA